MTAPYYMVTHTRERVGHMSWHARFMLCWTPRFRESTAMGNNRLKTRPRQFHTGNIIKTSLRARSRTSSAAAATCHSPGNASQPTLLFRRSVRPGHGAVGTVRRRRLRNHGAQAAPLGARQHKWCRLSATVLAQNHPQATDGLPNNLPDACVHRWVADAHTNVRSAGWNQS